MRNSIVFLVVTAAVFSLAILRDREHTSAQEPTVIIVTNASDAVDDEDAVCPDVEQCTLRRALELANGLGAGAIETTLTFDPTVFDPTSPVTIALQAPLPALAHPGIVVDAASAGVVVDGTAIGENPMPGLQLTGDGQSVIGLAMQSFFGPCIQVNGEDVVLRSMTLGGCAIGIEIRGPRAHITRSSIGFTADGTPATTAIGIRVLANETSIGEQNGEPLPNNIGNGVDGIRIGGGVNLVTGTIVRHNRIGLDGDERPAPLDQGIVIHVPATNSAIEENQFANIRVAAIIVGSSDDDQHATSHTLRANRMTGIGGLGIDLGGDGLRNTGALPVDGPNNWLPSPAITKVLPAKLTGTACASCTIAIYLAEHRPGGEKDYGHELLGEVVAGLDGAFHLDFPPVEPGDWLVATATDAAGNTSEFSVPHITGSGSVTCSGTSLPAGWSHRGFFGANATQLGTSFPASGPDAGKVTAIYRLIDGTGQYLRWIAGEPGLSTLATLEPGEAYFFLTSSALTLAGGITLTVPYSVSLAAGWNDFVYIGHSGHFRDALPLGEALDGLHRYDAGWQTAEASSLPEWARDFAAIVPCAAYQVELSSPAILVPLQP